MNIILLDNIDKVGIKHQVVKVKDGFGRNFLIPKGLGIVANKPNMARLGGLIKQGEKKESVIIAAFQKEVAKLAGHNIKIAAKAGENGRLFGSVTAQHLSDALGDLGIDAEKRIIEMPDEVKDLGKYTATVKFHPEVEAIVNFEVVNLGADKPVAANNEDMDSAKAKKGRGKSEAANEDTMDSVAANQAVMMTEVADEDNAISEVANEAEAIAEVANDAEAIAEVPNDDEAVGQVAKKSGNEEEMDD